MHFSYGLLLAAASSALAIPVPSTYQWSMSNYSDGCVGVCWINVSVNAPAVTISGVPVPALSTWSTCSGIGPEGHTEDCTSDISGDLNGRSLSITMRGGTAGVLEYKFPYNGKTYAVYGSVNSASTREFTITPFDFLEL
ncbi:hypothetical protein BS50DRAFT_574160 [Corynespora cassiicola Philippines]|uniref:Uncharacterized protein n=1 Tax=Corynespora cassiicola Philippines TaxID=1448308 RepID=A0A2T2NQC5_CORCC|nr:hypothetical protein BS50DRAFT_574160 [Corynespora cassiicola Philippines]